jgi:hypothetical protein
MRAAYLIVGFFAGMLCCALLDYHLATKEGRAIAHQKSAFAMWLDAPTPRRWETDDDNIIVNPYVKPKPAPKKSSPPAPRTARHMRLLFR